ncbi:juvenile hormone-binding protein-like [Odontomachus brunneus]|uniref:juvenile hormone-binding protein-like n=1 Tax=Odontomachus brunneus TaxID=486640 RepID=UPI0013F1B9C8|nr:juvenile hormone-binding protein-like [Odontomachus brunneus]
MSNRDKMFAATLVLAFVVAHVAAEIPSYIHVCGRRNPNIDECILKNVENLKSKICEGIPELSVKPIEPMHIKRIEVFNADNSKLFLNDMYITGLCNYDIKFFHMNFEKLHFDVDLEFKRINISTIYDLNANIIVNIAMKGPIHITTDNVSAKAGIDLNVTNKDGKEHVYVSNMNLDLDIKGYEVDLSSFSDTQLNQMRKIGETFAIQSRQEIIKVIKPIIEKIVIKHILNFSNEIVKNFTFDELFPDRA